MTAANTGTWISLLEGNAGEDVETVSKALGDWYVLMVPAVLVGLFNDPELSVAARTLC
jgi:hypothetical protein